jgi:hypothetical protein
LIFIGNPQVKSMKDKLVREYFVWKDGSIDGIVVFEPCRNGSFMRSWKKNKTWNYKKYIYKGTINKDSDSRYVDSNELTDAENFFVNWLTGSNGVE